MLKLHLGCGAAILDHWDNLDLEPARGGIVCDLTRRLPYPSNVADFVFTEHFIEHLDEAHGLFLMSEIYRVLKPSGVVRISTPDLKTLINVYLRNDIHWYKPVNWSPSTPCQMVNGGMRMWGHQFLYDYTEIHQKMRQSGFTSVYEVQHKFSKYEQLKNLECRPYLGDLIIEAVKS